eukprot:CAMPEP_0176110252 /NCGR_PEP_ID=MMETSP0120_2-20121206/55363_1 /TAXON_ID=160619 /ORGANISM="Kryptoperidinium foliaceum, Strain CCMP 1326" /LENGTH=41 /DNA_ID= /DNA_START= /DNA_END= /DNA_ORIENTATION=
MQKTASTQTNAGMPMTKPTSMFARSRKTGEYSIFAKRITRT